MEELIGAVARGAGWVGSRAVRLYELVGPTPDEEREPGKPKERRARPGSQGPLTEEQIRRAEAELTVEFPPEYRAYLLDPSTGDAVNPLSPTADGWRWATTCGIEYDLLAEDFPHPDSYAAADDALGEREPRQDDFPHPAAFDEVYRVWEDEVEEFERRKKAGAVVIRDGGCGFSTLLAVTGPLKGTVWFDGRATCDLILPLRCGDRPGTFGEWLTGETPTDPW
ncbi:SMI1/KNR4 family protein [Streptomyces sp. NPDC003691]